MKFIIDSQSYKQDPDSLVNASDFSGSRTATMLSNWANGANAFASVYTPEFNTWVDEGSKAMLDVYAQSGIGNELTSPYRYAVDSVISNTFGIPLEEATRRHDYFMKALSGGENRRTGRETLQGTARADAENCG